jgi:hypothetical protein
MVIVITVSNYGTLITSTDADEMKIMSGCPEEVVVESAKEKGRLPSTHQGKC